MSSRLIDVGGYSILVYEQGEGPTLVFAHSLTFDSAMWQSVADQLSGRFHVVRIDLPGHGGSGTPGEVFTLEDIADDVDKVLGVMGIEGAVWAGHSMGGMVGMRLAIRHPSRLRAMALLNTSAEAEIEGARDMFHYVNERSRGKPSDKATVDFVLQLMFSARFLASEPERVAPYRKLLFEPPDAEGTYRAARAVIWRDSVLDQLAAVDMPTLVVTGNGDTAVPASFGETIAAAICGSRLLALDDCGHLSPEERPVEVARALTTFFEEVRA